MLTTVFAQLDGRAMAHRACLFAQNHVLVASVSTVLLRVPRGANVLALKVFKAQIALNVTLAIINVLQMLLVFPPKMGRQSVAATLGLSAMEASSARLPAHKAAFMANVLEEIMFVFVTGASPDLPVTNLVRATITGQHNKIPRRLTFSI